MFQSLLWWICHFDLSLWLYLLRMALFQSLLWWICHFDQLWWGQIYSVCTVSILVMMDLSFWPDFLGLLLLQHQCFNPCYDGFVILTSSIFNAVTASAGFNPCYDGFVILTPVQRLHLLAWFRFQSLLWWICHFDCGKLW